MGDGATRSRIEDGWHPNWESKKKGKGKKAEDPRTEKISMSRAMQKKSFAGATMSNAEDFKYDMTLQLGGERER